MGVKDTVGGTTAGGTTVGEGEGGEDEEEEREKEKDKELARDLQMSVYDCSPYFRGRMAGILNS